jgi:hypothetical protein
MFCIVFAIQLSFSGTFATVRFFLLMCSKSKGNRATGDFPLSQLEFQNSAVLPSCTVTLVAAAKEPRRYCQLATPSCTKAYLGLSIESITIAVVELTQMLPIQ